MIFVVEGGRVVERGSHAALLARGGTYARLYHTQFEKSREDSRILAQPIVRSQETLIDN